jgi:hypothetical protein
MLPDMPLRFDADESLLVEPDDGEAAPSPAASADPAANVMQQSAATIGIRCIFMTCSLW